MSFWPVRPFVTFQIATLGRYESTGDVLRHLFRYSIVNERWQDEPAENLVELIGIEPTTSGLQSQRSPN